MTPHARPMAEARRRRALRWYAGLAAEVAVLLLLFVAVIAAASAVPA